MENEVMDNLKSWLENPYWGEYYNEAPSDECKRYIAYEFYYSDTEDEETGAEMDRIEETLSPTDLRYIARYEGNSPKKAVLLEKARQREQ